MLKILSEGMDNTNKTVLISASSTAQRWKQLARFISTGENNFWVDNMLSPKGQSTAVPFPKWSWLQYLLEQILGETSLLHTYRIVSTSNPGKRHIRGTEMAWLSLSKQKMSLCMSSVWERLSSKPQVWLHEIKRLDPDIRNNTCHSISNALAARSALKTFSWSWVLYSKPSLLLHFTVTPSCSSVTFNHHCKCL